MIKKTIPSQWQTERLLVTDSTLTEIVTLQVINDLVPETRTWMQRNENAEYSMRLALEKGVLPPVPERSLEHFRL